MLVNKGLKIKPCMDIISYAADETFISLQYNYQNLAFVQYMTDHSKSSLSTVNKSDTH